MMSEENSQPSHTTVQQQWLWQFADRNRLGDRLIGCWLLEAVFVGTNGWTTQLLEHDATKFLVVGSLVRIIPDFILLV
eukprot:scaffold10139_cov80-Attheya_sp.AAC.4